jgi:hypothetical protein
MSVAQSANKGFATAVYFIFIDTNIRISAARTMHGPPHLTFLKAAMPSNQGIICEQNLEEFRRVFVRKFPNPSDLMESFLAMILPIIV